MIKMSQITVVEGQNMIRGGFETRSCVFGDNEFFKLI